MNVNLIRAIRLGQLRIGPAVKKQKELYPAKERFMRYLRVLSPLIEIPLNIADNKIWYLDGSIAPQTKTGDAYRELQASGIKADSIWHREIGSIGLYNKLLRIAFRAPLVLGLLVGRIRTISKLDLLGIQVLIGYAAYRQFFKVHSRLKPIILSDISPFLHMQWAGALAAGNEVMWWQDDYHHYKGFSDENYCPYHLDLAAVLNEYGLITAKFKNDNVLLLKRPSIQVSQFRAISNDLKIGFASNVLFRASESDYSRINKVKCKLEGEEVLVRLHPNSKLHGIQPKHSWMHFAPREQTIEEFVDQVDLVIVGNSAVQLKLICAGVPVIHISGFDEFGFDSYEYCQLGLVFGKQDLEELRLEDVQAFYGHSAHHTKLKEYVGVNDQKLQPLTVLKEYA